MKTILSWFCMHSGLFRIIPIILVRWCRFDKYWLKVLPNLPKMKNLFESLMKIKFPARSISIICIIEEIPIRKERFFFLKNFSWHSREEDCCFHWLTIDRREIRSILKKWFRFPRIRDAKSKFSKSGVFRNKSGVYQEIFFSNQEENQELFIRNPKGY